MNNVVLDPDHDGNQRFIQNVVNKYHPYLDEIIFDYRLIRDQNGHISAITPYTRMTFKDGSQMVLELQKKQSEHRFH